MKPDLKLTPFWWDTAPLVRLEPNELAATADVVVVGAGITGLCCALELARSGRTVVICDTGQPGIGASTRNGGIASGALGMSFANLAKTVGLSFAKQAYAEADLARLHLKNFVSSEKINCTYREAGRFIGAYKASHFDSLAREAELLNRHLDFEIAILPRGEQRREIGSDHYHGGMLMPRIAALHPAMLMTGIVERCVEAGVHIHAGTEVLSIDREKKKSEFQVTTRRGVVRASNVVVATNGYTGNATPWLRRRIIPIPSQIIVTEKLERSVMDRLMPKRRMLSETRNVHHYYRPSHDDTRIVFGGRAGALTQDPERKMRRLKQGLDEIFPELMGVGISHTWWGYTGFTFDFLPKVLLHDNVHYAVGFCGAGVVWGPWLAKKVADSITENHPPESAFARKSFQTRPFYKGYPWFLPAAIAWKSICDRFGK